MPTPYDMSLEGHSMYGVQPGPVMGASQYPPQIAPTPPGSFNYGLAPPGPFFLGPGGVGAMGVGAIGAMPGAIMGAGMLAGFAEPFVNSPFINALSFADPTTLGGNMMMRGGFNAIRGGLMGTGMSGGLATAAAGLPVFAGGLAAMAGVRYGTGRFIGGAQEQNTLAATLSNLPFASNQAAGFRGFGYQELNQVGAMMREFDAADPFTTMTDLNRMMNDFNEMGIAQGVRDAREFAQKFTNFAESVRDIAMELGTTLEDATRMFGQMRSAGFYTSADVMGNTRALQSALNRGISQDAFMGAQAAGAGITRGSQMTGRSGAAVASRFAEDFITGATSRTSGGLGIFSDASLMDMTGTDNLSDASATMGTRMVGALTGYLQSAAGRAFMAGVGEMEGGEFTGGVSRAALNRAVSGGAALQDLSNIAGPRLRAGRSQASFLTNQGAIASSILEAEEGVEAVYASLQEQATRWARDKGISGDTAVRTFLQNVVGLEERDARELSTFLENIDELRSARLRSTAEATASAAQRLDFQRNRTFAGLRQRVVGSVEDATSPLAQMGANVSAGLDQFGMEAVDMMFGVNRSTLTDASRMDFRRRVAAGGAADIQAVRFGSVGSMQDGTALRGLAARRGVAAAVDVRQRILQGEALTDSDFEGSLRSIVGERATSFVASEGSRDAANNFYRRFYNAMRTGDRKAQDAAIEDLKRFTRTQALQDSPTMFGEASFDDSEVAMSAAYIAHSFGHEDVAKRLLSEGGIRSMAYEDTYSIEQKAAAAGRAAGLDGRTAEALAKGGTGSRVFSLMSGEGALTPGQMRQLANSVELGAGSSNERLVELFNQSEAVRGRLGRPGDFSADEIQAAFNVIQGRNNEFDPLGNAFTAILDPGRTDEQLQAMADLVTQGNMSRAAQSDVGAMRANLIGLPREIRERMGDSYDQLLSAANGNMSGLEGGVRSLMNQAIAGNFDNVAGGTQLSRIGARLRRARESRSGMMDVLGISSETDLRRLAREGGFLGDDNVLSEEERLAMVDQMGMMQLMGELGSGSDGGLALRGQTMEQQMATQMGITVGKMRDLTEVIDTLVTGITGNALYSSLFESEN